MTCGNYDYNMLNYEETDRALREAAAGKEAETCFFVITSEGYFRYFYLQFADEKLTVSYASAVFDEDGREAGSGRWKSFPYMTGNIQRKDG